MRAESRTKESQRLSNHFPNVEIHGVGRGVNVVVLKGGGCEETYFHTNSQIMTKGDFEFDSNL